VPAPFDVLAHGGTVVVGPYLVTFEIARGSMGVVYLGYETSRDRLVALKFLKPDLCADAHIVQLFHREAAAAAHLHHPNIVTIYGQGHFAGRPYFAMELIYGESLRDVVRNGPLNPLRGVDFMLQASAGLAAAWAKGRVHRDVKPENLMLQGQGLLKITDFGCVTDLGQRPSEDSTAFVVGTPHFMSPEQARGWPVDCRSDIYSLGATFYYLFTGRVPFDGPTIMDVLVRQIHDQLPPMRTHRIDLPRALCWVVERMLAKDPADRYQDYAELRHDLEKLRQALLRRAPATSPDGARTDKVTVDSTPDTPTPLTVPTAA